MPVYNGGRYVREAIDSILAQTFTDFELIVVNDGSTDDTEQIIQSYKSDKIRYYANDKNRGIAYSFNRAIDLSRGEFLAVAEADDINHPRRLEIQTAYISANDNVGLVCGKHKVFTDKKPPFDKITDTKQISRTAKNNKHGLIFYSMGITHPSTMYRRKVLVYHNIKYNEKYKIACDVSVFMALHGVTDMMTLPCYLVHYRIHDENASRDMNATNHEANDIYREFFQRTFGLNFRGKFIPESCETTADEFAAFIAFAKKILSHTKKDPNYEQDFLVTAAAGLAYKHFRFLAKSMNNKQAFQLYRKTPLLRSIDNAKKSRLWVRYIGHHLGIKFL